MHSLTEFYFLSFFFAAALSTSGDTSEINFSRTLLSLEYHYTLYLLLAAASLSLVWLQP